MATYSKYVGTDWYSVVGSLILTDSRTQSYTFEDDDVYSNLFDNQENIIMPSDIRSAIISISDSNPIKDISIGNSRYIGIQAYTQSINLPIYIGSRSLGGSDLVSQSVRSSGDLIINNTKVDSDPLKKTTTISILSGSVPSVQTRSPKIMAQQVSVGSTNRIDVSFVSQTGDVSVISQGPGSNDPGSNVLINGISYPSVASASSASDGMTLVYRQGLMSFENLYYQDPGFYGATGTYVPIYGSTTYINGYELAFTDSRMCPIEIGDVQIGETFSSMPISEILKKVIYDYIAPECALTLLDPSQEYLEVGTYPSLYLGYSVTKKTLDTYPIALSNMSPNQITGISGIGDITITGQAKGIMRLPLEMGTSSFHITVSDGESYSSSRVDVQAGLPFFYGFSSSKKANTGMLSDLIKSVSPKRKIGIDIATESADSSESFYFIYDYSWGNFVEDIMLNGVLTNQNIVFDQIYDSMLSSPEGNWAYKRFRVYRSSTYLTNLVLQGKPSTYLEFYF